MPIGPFLLAWFESERFLDQDRQSHETNLFGGFGWIKRKTTRNYNVRGLTDIYFVERQGRNLGKSFFKAASERKNDGVIFVYFIQM